MSKETDRLKDELTISKNSLSMVAGNVISQLTADNIDWLCTNHPTSMQYLGEMIAERIAVGEAGDKPYSCKECSSSGEITYASGMTGACPKCKGKRGE